jgi:hypothetical protein
MGIPDGSLGPEGHQRQVSTHVDPLSASDPLRQSPRTAGRWGTRPKLIGNRPECVPAHCRTIAARNLNLIFDSASLLAMDPVVQGALIALGGTIGGAAIAGGLQYAVVRQTRHQVRDEEARAWRQSVVPCLARVDGLLDRLSLHNMQMNLEDDGPFSKVSLENIHRDNTTAIETLEGVEGALLEFSRGYPKEAVRKHARLLLNAVSEVVENVGLAIALKSSKIPNRRNDPYLDFKSRVAAAKKAHQESRLLLERITNEIHQPV